MKLDDFQGYFQGPPGMRQHGQWVVNWCIPGRTVNSQIASSTMQDRQCNINHAGIKGYEKTWMQNERTEDAGYRIEEIPRSLVAPLKRGRRIHTKYRGIFYEMSPDLCLSALSL